MEITAAVMTKADGMLTRRKIRLEQVELDDPRDNEVLVRISSCGICGTDRGAIHGLEPYPTPGVLGHEGCGIVEAVGREVTAWKPGDRVMIGFAYCGYCRSCRRGQHRYCENGAKLNFSGYRMDGSSGMKRRNGEAVAGRFFQQSSWATHALAVENQLARVPDGLDLDTTGPYGCSISTGAGTILNELRPEPGSSLAVFGAGNVGLAAIMAAQLSGVTRIIAVDKDRKRLALARNWARPTRWFTARARCWKSRTWSATSSTIRSRRRTARTSSPRRSRRWVSSAPARWWAARRRPSS